MLTLYISRDRRGEKGLFQKQPFRETFYKGQYLPYFVRRERQGVYY